MKTMTPFRSNLHEAKRCCIGYLIVALMIAGPILIALIVMNR
jgi:hypothetical protein